MDNQTTSRDVADNSNPNWGPDAPRGGRAVMNRILKEKATCPAFPCADTDPVAPRRRLQPHDFGAL